MDKPLHTGYGTGMSSIVLTTKPTPDPVLDFGWQERCLQQETKLTHLEQTIALLEDIIAPSAKEAP